MPHTISLFLTLAVFWLLNSGHYTPLIMSLGLISIVLVLYIAHRMDVVDHESQPLLLQRRIPSYHLWLTKEIILANITVVKHIWLGNETISPVLAVIKAHQKTDMGKVIYANSITLTPGTVSIDLEGEVITVHALNDDSAADLLSGEMNRRVCKVES